MMTFAEARVIVPAVLTVRAVDALHALGLHQAAAAILAGQPWPSLPEARRMQRRSAPTLLVSVHRASRRRCHLSFNTDRCAVCGALRRRTWEPRWCA